MARKQPPRPTEGELAILQVLWERGPSTVRQVNDALGGAGDAGPATKPGYTTTLKLMQIMADKGLVRRRESGRLHIYTAVTAQDRTQRRLVRDLLARAFGGSAGKLAMAALSAGKVSAEEMKQIRMLLDTKGESDERAD